MNSKNLTIEQKQRLANDDAFICDDCKEFCDIEDGANFKWQHGILTLCHGCGEEFETDCQQSQSEIDIEPDQYGYYPEDRPYQSDIPEMADYGDRDY